MNQAMNRSIPYTSPSAAYIRIRKKQLPLSPWTLFTRYCDVITALCGLISDVTQTQGIGIVTPYSSIVIRSWTPIGA